MKATILLITLIFLLTGCSQNNENVMQVDETPDVQRVVLDETKAPNTYNDEELNISFEFPLNWEMYTQENEEHTVYFEPEGDYNRTIIFDYQSESFDEYERRGNVGKSPKAEDYTEDYLVNFTEKLAEEMYFADNPNYPARMYQGFESVKYIIKIDGKYVMFRREYWLNQQEEQDLVEILNSLSF